MSRLTAYRNIEGISQSELAEQLAVQVQRISEVERGVRAATFDLTQLGYSSSRLSSLPDMTEPLHRHYTRTREAAKKRAKEIVRLGGEVFSDLRRSTRVSVRLERDVGSAERDLDDVEQLASDVRVVMLGIEESGPIRNLTAAVERAGIAIVPVRELHSDGESRTIDGLSSWVEDQPTIALDPDVPGERFRFSLAHEVGHLMMHGRRHDYTEDEASRFAGSLLIPRSALEYALRDAKLPTLSDFLHLKATFGVSVAALIYRARDLGLISADRFRSLQIQKSTVWGRRNEPNDSAITPGGLLATMIERQGGVAAVSQALGVAARHIALLIDWDQRPLLRLVQNSAINAERLPRHTPRAHSMTSRTSSALSIGATMSSENNRHVAPHPDGGWQVEKPHAERPSARTDTQAEAINRAREIVHNLGGGEVVVHGRDGTIRDSDTVAPGRDPNPPRDTR